MIFLLVLMQRMSLRRPQAGVTIADDVCFPVCDLPRLASLACRKRERSESSRFQLASSAR